MISATIIASFPTRVNNELTLALAEITDIQIDCQKNVFVLSMFVHD